MPNALVVDDDTAMRETLVAFLRQHGYAVLPAPDGLDALRQIQANQPDILLLDLALPSASGLKVLRSLSGRAPDLMVIVMSGVLDDEWSERAAFALGAKACLRKPFRLAALQSGLKSGAQARAA